MNAPPKNRPQYHLGGPTALFMCSSYCKHAPPTVNTAPPPVNAAPPTVNLAPPTVCYAPLALKLRCRDFLLLLLGKPQKKFFS